MAPGRPSLKVTIDFNDPIKALDNVKTLFDNKKFKENIKLFAKILLKDTDELVCAEEYLCYVAPEFLVILYIYL